MHSPQGWRKSKRIEWRIIHLFGKAGYLWSCRASNRLNISLRLALIADLWSLISHLCMIYLLTLCSFARFLDAPFTATCCLQLTPLRKCLSLNLKLLWLSFYKKLLQQSSKCPLRHCRFPLFPQIKRCGVYLLSCFRFHTLSKSALLCMYGGFKFKVFSRSFCGWQRRQVWTLKQRCSLNHPTASRRQDRELMAIL